MTYYVRTEPELQEFSYYEDDRSVEFGDEASPDRYDLCGDRSFTIITLEDDPDLDITSLM